MPHKYQPAARRAAAATAKVAKGTAGWVWKKYSSYTTELLPPPEPTHIWNAKRAASPDMSSISSCDGEGEIFPIKRMVSPGEAERVEREMGEAMREAFPKPLGGYADGMEPGRRGRRSRNVSRSGRQRERRHSDVVVAQDVGSSKAWKREMTAEEKWRREEIEREWMEKEERCRYEEENDMMDNVGENMFEPTMGPLMRSQRLEEEKIPMERSSYWDTRSSVITEPLECSYRGRQLHRGSNRVERPTRLRKERIIPTSAEEAIQTRRSNGPDRLELSHRKKEPAQDDQSENGFVEQPLRGRAIERYPSAQSGNCRQRIEPENFTELATAAAQVFHEKNVPKKAEQPLQQENTPLENKELEKKQSETKRPEETPKKDTEQGEDSDSDDALQLPKRVLSVPRFRNREDDEEEMPFAMIPISKSAAK